MNSKVIELTSNITFSIHISSPIFGNTGISVKNSIFSPSVIFIAVEKEPPYNVELYELDDEAIEAGRQEYLKDIETYKECLKTDTWHGYTTEQKINILSLPAWALK